MNEEDTLPPRRPHTDSYAWAIVLALALLVIVGFGVF